MYTKSLLELRALRAKDLSRYFEGKNDTTQLGECYKRWIIPPVLTSNCNDSRIYAFSEWGNAAGFTDFDL